MTREKIEEDLQRAKFISIRADDSTDVSSSENEVVYIHFSVQGVVQCYFVGMIACKSGDAQGVYEAINSTFQF